jgi:ABC-type transport system substrate-binding protein
MTKNLSICITCILFLLLSVNCGGGEKKQTETISNVKTSQGADPSVSAELGGAGFEKIAESLGYETYVISEDELIYFGDPRAKRAESSNISRRDSRTLRMEGQNSNYVENSEIQYLCYETLLETHPLTAEPVIPRLATHWKVSDDNMQFGIESIRLPAGQTEDGSQLKMWLLHGIF